MVAEFESDLIRLRTRKGIKVAKAKGRVRASRPNWLFGVLGGEVDPAVSVQVR
jgi:DNA invertase Pin-like site-specific DNA recombinase